MFSVGVWKNIIMEEVEPGDPYFLSITGIRRVSGRLNNSPRHFVTFHKTHSLIRLEYKEDSKTVYQHINVGDEKRVSRKRTVI